MSPAAQLMEVFERLSARFGKRHWWPAETPFEVCVGAILTQNTAWTNVEKAIVNLKQAGVLSPIAIHGLGEPELAGLIRPAGFFNVKSRRLKGFVRWLFEQHGGSLEQMFATPWQELRIELLKVTGIGPETCDSILLYAGNQPSFVVDAYTRRLFSRLGLLAPDASYEETRSLFMEQLPQGVPLYNEYHALIVEQCKVSCRVRPLCGCCCLAHQCPAARV